MEKECVLVWTTIGSTADGRGMASILVAERLAACVNVLPAMESFYRWNGGVSNDQERQLIMKTTIDKVDALKRRVHELHDYELPEFIVMPIAGGSEAYLSWIRESTSG
jgi:periplasmic divalent cation tolerance protein